MVPRLCLFLLLILRGGVGTTQTQLTDSVRSLLTQSLQLVQDEKFDDAQRIAQMALTRAISDGFGWGVGEAQRCLGQAYQNKDKKDSAILFFHQAADIFEKYGFYERQARALSEKARMVQSNKQFAEATALHFNVLKIYNEKLSPREAQLNLDIKATTLERMAVIMTNQLLYDKAESYALEAYDLFEKFGDKNQLGMCCTAVGNIYFFKNQYDQAAHYYQKSAQLCREIGRNAGRSLNNLALVLTKAKHYEPAVATYMKAIEQYTSGAYGYAERERVAQTYTNIGSTYHEKGDLDKALYFILRGIDSLNVLKSVSGLSIVYDELVTILEKKGDFSKALDYQKCLTVLQDSTIIKRQQSDLLEWQTKFETEKKNKEIQILNQEKVLARKNVWVMAVVLIGLIALGIILWQTFRHQQRAALARAEVEKIQLEKYAQQTLQESEMKLLRSQMNPHFIFNVLNSINRFVLENDSEKASEYLTKFSRLMRLVLENSRSEKVTLENELAALALYIELEAVRFKDKIRHTITVDPSVDKSFVRIPPLLIQPYVENAIWHGLMHRDEGGQIDINVNQPDEHMVEIIIKDNGIGRAAAAQLKSKSAIHKKSFGMQITSERLALVNKIFNTQTNVTIEDIYQNQTTDRIEKNISLGTKVTLKISC